MSGEGQSYESEYAKSQRSGKHPGGINAKTWKEYFDSGPGSDKDKEEILDDIRKARQKNWTETFKSKNKK